MGVLHGRGNRGEITRFVVKRLNVLLPATVTVMPHTTRSSLLIHSHDMVINDMMIHHLITNHHEVLVFRLPSFILLTILSHLNFPKFHLITGRASSPLNRTLVISFFVSTNSFSCPIFMKNLISSIIWRKFSTSRKRTGLEK